MGDDTPGAPVTGSWTHSFEEDDDDVEVYRPTLDYPFPPSRRGRRRLDFAGDDVVESAPGAADKPVPTASFQSGGQGSWHDPVPEQPGFQILEATPEMLRIRRE